MKPALPSACRLMVASLCLAVAAPGAATAEEALVAVAANFAEAMEQLKAEFETATAHELTVAAGSTGKLYAQIVQGAPFDVFLAADQRRPQLLEQDGQAVEGSRFTYAIGQLSLWSPDADAIGENGAATLRAGEFRRLAMANPDLAPYGAAAREVLERLRLYETLRGRIVMAENVGQAFAFTATRNAELGFVARSHTQSARNQTPGSRWDVPQILHTPIRQDAVLLVHGADNPAARAFLDHLKSMEARRAVDAYDRERQ